MLVMEVVVSRGMNAPDAYAMGLSDAGMMNAPGAYAVGLGHFVGV